MVIQLPEMDKNEEFLKRIQATFRIEADENIRNMTSNLLEMEKNLEDDRKTELIEITYREAHSLKGASRAVDMKEIESVCQPLENVFSALKMKKIALNSQVFDVLHKAVDLLKQLLFADSTAKVKKMRETIIGVKQSLALAESGKNTGKEDVKQLGDSVILNLEDSQTGGSIEVETDKNKSNEYVSEPLSDKHADRDDIKKVITENVRVSTKKLDGLLFQSEEMLSIKLSANQRLSEINAVTNKLKIWEKELFSIYPKMRKIQANLEVKEMSTELNQYEKTIKNISGFVEWAGSHIKSIEEDILKHRKNLYDNSYSTALKIDSLLEDVKKMLEVPFSVLFDTFPKVVRDLSHDVGKEINLEIKGGDMHIDRRILEEMKNPLLHILRNCIDNGIEKPKIRLRRNKDIKGNISVTIDRLDNNKVEIIVADDGNGINIKKLRQLYQENESVTSEELVKLDEQEFLNYIFKSGISTNNIVTDISGRGLGLAIVHEKIEQLGGQITVKSEQNIGTTFHIVLPLSMVSFRGVLIQLGDSKYIIPTSKIERITRFKSSLVKTIENHETIKINELVIPLVGLDRILGGTYANPDSKNITAIILGSKDKKIGFKIDAVVSEQEVLFKKFNKHLERVRNISGATILGDGNVVPILNASDLLISAAKETKTAYETITVESDVKEKKNRVLVVEDSITSRMLLKNILETAGYLVSTAIDGVDGFTKLKEGDFNALVSDVDMPRMNGFDLTQKVRADKSLTEIPVVLVTSLSKREDKERGIDVGANAYIIKSKFEQSNLLDVLTKLI
jgi:two-component system, chemotaxis family, sensor kinase CheA